MRLTVRVAKVMTGVLALALVAGSSPGSVRALASGSSGADAGLEILRRDPPDWYTPDLHRRVAKAGPEGVRVPDAAIPASALAIQGIRPGSWMVSPSWCTMNFVFRGHGRLFIGTAGHCVDRVGQAVTLFMAPDRLVRAGRVVQRKSRGPDQDFALVRIRPGLRSRVSPKMAIVGGPTGVFRGSGRRVLFHVGHGVGIGTGGTPRTGVSLRWRRDHYVWAGAGTPGDSGSPVRLSGGKAAGNLTHIVTGGRDVAPRLAGTRIGEILRMIGPRFSLVRAARDL